ncbi:MAG: S8 family serine peptidase [Planctomycetota bacterium]
MRARLSDRKRRRVRRGGSPGPSFSGLEPRQLLSGGGLAQASLTPLVLTGVPSTGGIIAPLDAQSGPLINLDDLTNDSRFTGLDGTGFSTVVIDTGADLDHPFFGDDADGDGISDRILYQYDFADNDADASDVNGHGSNVLSIAGSSGSVRGVAPGAGLIPLKVFSDIGTGTFAYLESALQWVVANAATYNIASVNMSLGDSTNGNFSRQLYGVSDELATLAAMDVLVIASAGNDFYAFGSAQGLAYPAADPNVLSVGATFDADIGGVSYASGAVAYGTGADRITPFSQRSTSLLDIMAPGARISGASANGGVVGYSGTSQASPHVAGLAVLAQQLAMETMGRRLTLDEFRTVLSSSATTVVDGDDENDNVTNNGASYGRVDALAMAEAILVMAGAGSNAKPTLSAFTPLTGVSTGYVSEFSHAELLAASDAIDDDGDTLSFRISGLGSGAVSVNGEAAIAGITVIEPGDTVRWTPPTTTDGTETVFSLAAFDGLAQSGAVDVSASVNSTPTLLASAAAGAVRGDIGLTLTHDELVDLLDIDDADDDALSIIVESVLDGTLRVNGIEVSNGATIGAGDTVNWTPGDTATGTTIGFAVRVRDAAVSSVNAGVISGSVNAQPTLGSFLTLNGGAAGQDFTISYESLLNVSDASDLENATITFEVMQITGLATLNGSTLKVGDSIAPGDTVVWSAPNNAAGTTTALQLRASDGTMTSDAVAPVRVDVNARPVISGDGLLTGANESSPFAFTPSQLRSAIGAFDANGDLLRFMVLAVNGGTLLVNGAQAIAGSTWIENGDGLSWTTISGNIGEQPAFTVRAFDGEVFSNEQALVSVDVNGRPTLTNIAPLTNAAAGVPMAITFEQLMQGVTASDPDGDSLTLRVTELGSGQLYSADGPLDISDEIGPGDTIVWTPAESAIGNVTAFRLAVNDGSQDSATSVAVQANVNAIPVANESGDIVGGVAGQPLAITYEMLVQATGASDAEGVLTLELASLASGTLTRLDGSAIEVGDAIASGSTVLWTPGIDARDRTEAFAVSVSDGTTTAAPTSQLFVLVDGKPLANGSGLLGAVPALDPVALTLASLIDAADAVDLEGFVVQARVTALGSGTLTINGLAANIGDVINFGDSVSWSPPADVIGATSVFAVAFSDGTLESDALMLTADVQPAPPGAELVDRRVDGVVSASGVVTLTVRDGDGPASLLTFDPVANAWTSTELGDAAALSDPAIWTAADRTRMVAVLTEAGLLVGAVGSGGDAQLVNLNASLGIDTILVSSLVSMTGTDGLTTLAALDADGRLGFFSQAAAGGWQFVDVEAEHLSLNNQTTPAWVGELTTYVTPWNQQTVAGLTADGRIQAVWWAPGLAAWRATDLSSQTGAGPLVGNLTAFVTPWNGINLAGTDAAGNVVVTWWVPGFSQWVTTDLTAAFDGPTLQAGSLGSVVTSWGALNIAGLDDEGQVRVYWWAPGIDAIAGSDRWLVNTLPTTEAPAATVSTFTGADGSMTVTGITDDGDITRSWWSPQTGVWQSETIQTPSSSLAA